MRRGGPETSFAMRGLRSVALAAALVLLGGAIFSLAAMSQTPRAQDAARKGQRATPARGAQAMFREGRRVFRHETFGDEAFWGGTIQLHRAIAGEANGGVGPGVSPETALKVGLKVDANRIPRAVARAIKQGKVDLEDPKTTLALLKLDAVVGVKGRFSRNGKRLTSMGITCALCHSTVNNSFAPGIGQRRDGWPNRDLNVGAIVSLAPNLQPVADLLGADVDTVKKVLAAWGPGKFDASLTLDGKGFRPDGKTAAVLLPAAYGLAGVDRATYTGWGSVTYWNALVANLEMHGQGNFTDTRLDDAAKFPVAARHRMGHTPRRARSGQQAPAGAALLPAGAGRAKAARRQLQSQGGQPRQAPLRGRGHVRELPRQADVLGARIQPARAVGGVRRQLPGRSLARGQVPHDAAARPVGANEGRLLPRRSLPDPRGGGRPLRRLLRPRALGRPEERPRPVPQVAVSEPTPILGAVTAAALGTALALVFFYAPIDADQGFVQKIFYLHVPLGIVTLAGFVAGGIMGAQFLRTRDRSWDLRSYVAIHLSLVLAVGVLATGSIWAKASWGHWWVWSEPMLVSFLIVFLLYCCYQPLRFAIQDPDLQARTAAVFAVMAGAFVPLNFVAVRLAEAVTHPRVLSATGGQMPGAMRLTFVAVLLAMALLFVLLWRLELLRKTTAIELRALGRSLDERAPSPVPSWAVH